ncbi:MAG: hypothetical protein J0H00_05450 [Burkholderiales bacterium]|nr:hypothetical protein [Burkholderiales bacterium]OJX00877.1 MAG: hypothetical protein BGO72_05770 [Burkholderiales bacterium 70-64]
MCIRNLLAPVVAAGFLCTAAAHAAEGSVRILQPAEGATLDSMAQNRLVYEVDPGPQGDHIHVYVDDREVGILRQRKGNYALETLAPGRHELCVKVVNKAHTPIGLQKCVAVTVD